jgi:XTP/dITP diphosphohydrolase
VSGRPAPRVVLATRNPGKIREIVAIYARLPIDWRSLDDFPDVDAVPETGMTYADNAVAKARHAAEACGLPALADDAGVEIDALDGAPGVRSARFLGPEATDADRNARVLQLLQDVPPERRGARYRAAVALALPGGGVRVFEGVCEGRIGERALGAGGFGYDPIFIPKGYTRSMAELPIEVKNAISHRARALRAAEPWVAALGTGRLQDRRSGSAN